ncbi:asparagine synthase (glutamine-hydrolyzing) [Pseudomonas sp. YQ_5]|uniref:asparagine synthase (glutamine-hydrolyzing) n=2 Tax=Pseudomonas TaxID=286 RepID=UPI00370CAC0F|nr:asparagine synthase (glutamine-hydrolyzing) [Pseudomonas putida]
MMCGIFGYYDLSGKRFPDNVLERMGDKISYRGPDGRGIYHDPITSVAVGNQRLAILDVEHGQQPFISDDQKVVVVQNGEIFNHVEIAQSLKKHGYDCKTHCDTEVILGLYLTKGIAGLKELNGMFAIAIWDGEKQKLILFRDRVGEKPLYYSLSNEKLIFASEIKAILEAKENKNICQKALEQYLAFNYVPSPLTMFEGIYHVEPGVYLEIDTSGVRTTKWWDCSGVETKQQSESEWIEEFNNCLDDSVRIRLRSDVPFGAFLSGGVDSSTIVGLMARHLESPVKTYSIGFNDPRYDESPYAQEAAERFSTEHTCEIVHPDMLGMWSTAIYHCDQPHGDVSFMPTLKVAQLAAKDVKMVLTGDGADELFAGYEKYANFFANNNADELSVDQFERLYSKNIALFTSDNLPKLLVKDLTSPDVIGSRLKEVFSEVRHFDRINQALYIDTKLLLSGNNLVKPDRMGMAASIENRAPFLDHRMIELAFSMPGRLKLNESQTKYIYKKSVEGLIGQRLAYRKKQMFTVPVGEWFKNELYSLCQDLLLSERTRGRNLFNSDYVRVLLENHVNNIQNNTREIRALMAVELWARKFMD